MSLRFKRFAAALLMMVLFCIRLPSMPLLPDESASTTLRIQHQVAKPFQTEPLTLAVHSAPYNDISSWWTGGDIGTGSLVSCPWRCRFIGKVEQAEGMKADAVLVDLTLGDEPPWEKPVNQLWIGTHWEAPAHYPSIMDQDFMNRFDLTSSYRADSDIPLFNLYLTSSIDFAAVAGQRPEISFAEKAASEMMSVWISNCDRDRTSRLALVIQLMQLHVSIASYGTCLHNKNLSESDETIKARSTKTRHAARHLFMLAAENALCPYYHTEKIFQAFVAGVVPVYLGYSSTVDEYIPYNSTIKVTDFSTTEELAAHLKQVASDEQLYNSYMAWRRRPLPEHILEKMRRPHPSRCEVCAALHLHRPGKKASAETCQARHADGQIEEIDVPREELQRQKKMRAAFQEVQRLNKIALSETSELSRIIDGVESNASSVTDLDSLQHLDFRGLGKLSEDFQQVLSLLKSQDQEKNATA